MIRILDGLRCTGGCVRWVFSEMVSYDKYVQREGLPVVKQIDELSTVVGT